MTTRRRSPNPTRTGGTVSGVKPVTLFNPGTDSLVFDSAGFSVDPGDRVPGNLSDPVTAAAVDRGALLVADEVAPTTVDPVDPTEGD